MRNSDSPAIKGGLLILVLGMLIYGVTELLPIMINSQPTESLTATLPPTFEATIAQPVFCHNGPNDSYKGAFIVSADTPVKVLAMTIEGDWFMIQGNGIGPCWVKSVALTLPPNIDLDRILKFITAFTLDNTPCLIYPSVGSEAQTVIPVNWRVVAYGKSNQQADWVLVVPHDSTEFCWVENAALSGFINIYLPVERVDIVFSPTPTFTLTPTDTPTLTGTPIPTLTKKPLVILTFTRTPKQDNGGGDDNPTPISPTDTIVPPTPIPPTPIPPTPIPPTPIPPTPVPPTPTLCWPPGHCK
jgi:hypothetical protein